MLYRLFLDNLFFKGMIMFPICMPITWIELKGNLTFLNKALTERFSTKSKLRRTIEAYKQTEEIAPVREASYHRSYNHRGTYITKLLL